MEFEIIRASRSKLDDDPMVRGAIPPALVGSPWTISVNSLEELDGLISECGDIIIYRAANPSEKKTIEIYDARID